MDFFEDLRLLNEFGNVSVCEFGLCWRVLIRFDVEFVELLLLKNVLLRVDGFVWFLI